MRRIVSGKRLEFANEMRLVIITTIQSKITPVHRLWRFEHSKSFLKSYESNHELGMDSHMFEKFPVQVCLAHSHSLGKVPNRYISATAQNLLNDSVNCWIGFHEFS